MGYEINEEELAKQYLEQIKAGNHAEISIYMPSYENVGEITENPPQSRHYLKNVNGLTIGMLLLTLDDTKESLLKDFPEAFIIYKMLKENRVEHSTRIIEGGKEKDEC